MPNGRTHRIAGAVTGGGAALYRARAQSAPHQLAEAVGGTAGGLFGGMLPDVFEPALSSWHRSFAHSWTTGLTLTTVTGKLESWEQSCRTRAEHYRSLRDGPSIDPMLRVWYWIAEYFWRAAAGFAAGLLTGYLSHLALDAMTPRGLPLISISR